MLVALMRRVQLRRNLFVRRRQGFGDFVDVEKGELPPLPRADLIEGERRTWL